ncbi:MAG: hypothetical protein WBF13_08435 [Candidatus Zixiibacteriota bacterium]
MDEEVLDPKKTQRSHTRSLGIGVFIFVVSGLLSALLVREPIKEHLPELALGILISLTLAVVGYVLSETISLCRRFDDNFREVIAWLKSHQNNLIEMWAGRSPHDAVRFAENMPFDEKKWIIVKFMEKAIGGAFSQAGNQIAFNCSEPDYSRILGKLLFECQKEIRMSCPWTPSEWFDLLGLEVCRECRRDKRKQQKCKLDEIGRLPRNKIHPHIRALFGVQEVPPGSRSRLVVTQDSLEEFTKDKCYRAFWKLARLADIEQYWVKADELPDDVHLALWHEENGKLPKDVNLLDDIVVYWRPEKGTKMMGRCFMLTAGDEYMAVTKLLKQHNKRELPNPDVLDPVETEKDMSAAKSSAGTPQISAPSAGAGTKDSLEATAGQEGE